MRVLLLGPTEEWVKSKSEELEVRTAPSVAEAITALSTFEPNLLVVDPTVVGDRREELLKHAEAIGCVVIASANTAIGIKIPGSTLQELEKYAIIQTLRAVGGSTSKAAKQLGISVRKIQYRLKDWQTRPADIVAQGEAAGPGAIH